MLCSLGPALTLEQPSWKFCINFDDDYYLLDDARQVWNTQPAWEVDRRQFILGFYVFSSTSWLIPQNFIRSVDKFSLEFVESLNIYFLTCWLCTLEFILLSFHVEFFMLEKNGSSNDPNIHLGFEFSEMFFRWMGILTAIIVSYY